MACDYWYLHAPVRPVFSTTLIDLGCCYHSCIPTLLTPWKHRLQDPLTRRSQSGIAAAIRSNGRYHDAFLTPGNSPNIALSLNWCWNQALASAHSFPKEENLAGEIKLNLRTRHKPQRPKTPDPFPETVQRFLMILGRVAPSMLANCNWACKRTFDGNVVFLAMNRYDLLSSSASLNAFLCAISRNT